MTEDVQYSLLQSFVNVVAACHKVTITGAPACTASVEATMMPDLISGSAILWDLYTIARSLKDQADDLAIMGHYVEATHRYSFLMKFITEPSTSPSFGTALDEDKLCVAAWVRTAIIAADCTLAWFHLRLRSDAMFGPLAEVHEVQKLCLRPFYAKSFYTRTCTHHVPFIAHQ